MDLDIPLHVIGVVRTDRTGLETTPIQAAINRSERGTIEIAAEYADGLDGLADFDYAWMLTWLRRSDEPAAAPDMKQTPFLLRRQRRKIGLFATRGPKRVNSIGLSLIELLVVQDRTVSFAGVDVVDGTPVIDIKPYVTRFDRPPGTPQCGWFDDVAAEQGVTPAQLA